MAKAKKEACKAAAVASRALIIEQRQKIEANADRIKEQRGAILANQAIAERLTAHGTDEEEMDVKNLEAKYRDLRMSGRKLSVYGYPGPHSRLCRR
jgi:hypothetical protein